MKGKGVRARADGPWGENSESPTASRYACSAARAAQSTSESRESDQKTVATCAASRTRARPATSMRRARPVPARGSGRTSPGRRSAAGPGALQTPAAPAAAAPPLPAEARRRPAPPLPPRRGLPALPPLAEPRCPAVAGCVMARAACCVFARRTEQEARGGTKTERCRRALSAFASRFRAVARLTLDSAASPGSSSALETASTTWAAREVSSAAHASSACPRMLGSKGSSVTCCGPLAAISCRLTSFWICCRSEVFGRASPRFFSIEPPLKRALPLLCSASPLFSPTRGRRPAGPRPRLVPSAEARRVNKTVPVLVSGSDRVHTPQRRSDEH